MFDDNDSNPTQKSQEPAQVTAPLINLGTEEKEKKEEKKEEKKTAFDSPPNTSLNYAAIGAVTGAVVVGTLAAVTVTLPPVGAALTAAFASNAGPVAFGISALSAAVVGPLLGTPLGAWVGNRCNRTKTPALVPTTVGQNNNTRPSATGCSTQNIHGPDGLNASPDPDAYDTPEEKPAAPAPAVEVMLELVEQKPQLSPAPVTPRASFSQSSA